MANKKTAKFTIDTLGEMLSYGTKPPFGTRRLEECTLYDDCGTGHFAYDPIFPVRELTKITGHKDPGCSCATTEDLARRLA